MFSSRVNLVLCHSELPLEIVGLYQQKQGRFAIDFHNETLLIVWVALLAHRIMIYVILFQHFV